MTRARDPRELAERFWAKVNKTDDCWRWLGGQNRGGPVVRMRLEDVEALGLGRCPIQQANRVAWALTHGRAPVARIWRTCTRIDCVRPDHYATVCPLDSPVRRKVSAWHETRRLEIRRAEIAKAAKRLRLRESVAADTETDDEEAARIARAERFAR